MSIARVYVEVSLAGKHQDNLNNLAEAILDVLAQTRVVINNRIINNWVSCIPRWLITYSSNGKFSAIIVINEL